VVANAAGNASDMALDDTGNVWTWDTDFDGVLGDNGGPNSPNKAIEVRGHPKIAAIAESNDTDVAIATTGTVWGLGWNNRGQLCTGDTASHDAPVEVKNLTGVVAAAGGNEHDVYLLSNGSLVSCGLNSDGELGDGNFVSSTLPVTDVGLPASTVEQITAGPDTSEALLANGQVWAWGSGHWGQLGNGGTYDSTVPVHVELPSAASEIYAGGSEFRNGQSLALLANGQVWGWGNNSDGQLGNGGKRGTNPVPVQATAMPDVTFTSVMSGGDCGFGLDTNGNVWAWGSDLDDHLGDGGTSGIVLTPKIVMTGVDLISATAGDAVVHTP
jgi:alpha-tubulin suppressor-like RCC1 family protein